MTPTGNKSSKAADVHNLQRADEQHRPIRKVHRKLNRAPHVTPRNQRTDPPACHLRTDRRPQALTAPQRRNVHNPTNRQDHPDTLLHDKGTPTARQQRTQHRATQPQPTQPTPRPRTVNQRRPPTTTPRTQPHAAQRNRQPVHEPSPPVKGNQGHRRTHRQTPSYQHVPQLPRRRKK